jgi:transcriptional regulator with XRE-family HTH domain
MPQSLGTLIRERRQDLGLTQEELADRIGGSVRQAEISRLEAGHVALPRRERLEAIATALEVSIGELLVRTGWMQDGDQLASAIASSPRNGWTPDEVEALSSENVLALLDAVAAVGSMVEVTAAALAKTQETVDRLHQRLAELQNPRGEFPPKIGVLDRWETSAPFAA